MQERSTNLKRGDRVKEREEAILDQLSGRQGWMGVNSLCRRPRNAYSPSTASENLLVMSTATMPGFFILGGDGGGVGDSASCPSESLAISVPLGQQSRRLEE